jgi:hypothetical protein
MTADNLAARGMQHNNVCTPCHQAPEDARHLLINCSFSREVLQLLWTWFAMEGSPTLCSQDQDPADSRYVPMHKEPTHCAAKKHRGSFYTTGGMCGRRGTKECFRPNNKMSSRWLLHRKKKLIPVFQLSEWVDFSSPGCAILELCCLLVKSAWSPWSLIPVYFV